MKPATFEYSKTVMRQTGILYLLVGALLPMLNYVYLWLTTDSVSFEPGRFIGSVLAMEFVALIAWLVLFKMYGQLEVRIRDGILERRNGRHVEGVVIEELDRIAVTKSPSGETISIKLYPPFGRPMYIAGFQHMDSLLDMIEQRIGAKTTIQRKRMFVNWENPLFLLVAVSVLIMVLSLTLFFIQKLVGDNASYIFLAFLLCGVGVYSFFYKPMSRQWGVRFEKVDILIAIGVVIQGILCFAIAVMS